MIIEFSNLERLNGIYLDKVRIIRKHYYKLFHKAKANLLLNKIDNTFSLKKRLDEIIFVPETFNVSDEELDGILHKADKACNGIYNLLGSGDVVINPIQWNYDYVSGFHWKNQYSLSYDQVNLKSTSDIKKPRELSRSHHMLHCGIAYKVTNDKKYADLIFRQIQDWDEHNPLMGSVNWECAMDVAIRAINWMTALRLVSNHIDFAKVDHTFSNLLYKHGWFIYRNLEKNAYNNHNHYLSDVIGLIYLGLLFKDIDKEAARWFNEGKRELFKEMRYEILPSGMSYERSTNYNRLVLEIFLNGILLLKYNGEEIPSDIWYRLKNMFYFIMNSIQPNGETPIIGDQDNGRVLPFGTESIIDFRYLLSIGAVLFEDGLLKHYSSGYNVYCNMLADENAKRRFESVKEINTPLISQAYADIGFYIMRSKKFFVLFNASGKSKYPELLGGTHTHSDLLSFDLCYDGQSFIRDAGSYVYSSYPKERLKFRSTSMHNTITIDGLSQNIMKENVLWDFERNALPSIIKYDFNKERDIVIASHNGFERLDNPVNHKRSLSLNKIKDSLEIVDTLSCDGGVVHTFEYNLHFDTSVVLKKVDANTIVATLDNRTLTIRFSSNQLYELNILPTEISKSYGVKEASSKICLTIKADHSTDIKTIIE